LSGSRPKRLSCFPGIVKLWESPGRAGGLPNELKYILARDVLAVLNIRVSATMSHAILATGYNRDDEILYVADPASVRSVMKYSEVGNRWSATLSAPRGLASRSAFLIFPKGKNGF